MNNKNIFALAIILLIVLSQFSDTNNRNSQNSTFEFQIFSYCSNNFQFSDVPNVNFIKKSNSKEQHLIKIKSGSFLHHKAEANNVYKSVSNTQLNKKLVVKYSHCFDKQTLFFYLPTRSPPNLA